MLISLKLQFFKIHVDNIERAKPMMLEHVIVRLYDVIMTSWECTEWNSYWRFEKYKSDEEFEMRLALECSHNLLSGAKPVW
jgi:hypothetical protein